jgi:hypothetical protein
MITKFSVLIKDAFLRTAGIEDAYSKYYSDIPREVFNQLVSADPTATQDATGNPKKIGTYGQWILRMFQQKKLKLEDLYKVTRDLKTLVQLLPFLKREGISFNINQMKDTHDFFEFIREESYLIAPDIEEVEDEQFPEILFTEQYFLNTGQAEKVYEDEKEVIFVPLTLEASKFYGHGSDWCTLFPDMFKRYSSEDKLWILVHKNGDYSDRWQFHFPSQQFMDYYDSPIPQEDLEYFFRKNPGINDFFKKQYVSEEKLSKLFGNEDFFMLQIDTLNDLVQEGRAADVDRAEGYLSGEVFLDYDSGMTVRDIVKYLEISQENFLKIREYLEQNFSEELEEQEIDLTTPEDVYNAIDSLDADDIKNAIVWAYDDAARDAFLAKFQEEINESLSSHFGMDFTNWYPGGEIKITKEQIEKEWFRFAGLSLDEIKKRPYLLFNSSEDSRLDNYELSKAWDYAERSYVKDEYFNDQLTYRLSEL